MWVRTWGLAGGGSIQGNEPEGAPDANRVAITVPNPPGDALSPKQAERMGLLRAPSTLGLSTPAESGRLRPLELSGPGRGALIDPNLRESYRFPGITPAHLQDLVARAVGPLGFSTNPPQSRSMSNLSPGSVRAKPDPTGGTEVSGSIYAERNIRVDPEETRRRNRPRWAGLLGGLAAGIVRLHRELRQHVSAVDSH